MPFNVGGYILSNESSSSVDYKFPSIISNGLVCYLDSFVLESYPGSGTSWYDLSGNDYTWTIQGNITWNSTTGFTNFTGNSAGNGNKIYISPSNICAKLKTGQGGVGLTTLVWARNTEFGGWQKLVGNTDGENFIDLYQNPSTPYNYTQECSSTLYVNGVNVANNSSTMYNTGWKLWGATNVSSGLNSTPSYQLTIGNEPNSSPSGTNQYPWKGNIATFMLYNRILTTTEMTQIYDAQKSRFGL
jgi:hypothetical protein